MLLGQHATLAQSVERLTRNEQVDSSILSSGSGTARRWACRSCFIPFSHAMASAKPWEMGYITKCVSGAAAR